MERQVAWVLQRVVTVPQVKRVSKVDYVPLVLQIPTADWLMGWSGLIIVTHVIEMRLVMVGIVQWGQLSAHSVRQVNIGRVAHV